METTDSDSMNYLKLLALINTFLLLVTIFSMLRLGDNMNKLGELYNKNCYIEPRQQPFVIPTSYRSGTSDNSTEILLTDKALQ